MFKSASFMSLIELAIIQIKASILFDATYLLMWFFQEDLFYAQINQKPFVIQKTL